MGLTLQAKTGSSEAPNIEPGLYDARFDGIEAKVIESSAYDPNAFEWTFTLFDEGKAIYEDGEPVTVTGLTSQKINFGSKTTPKAVKWLKAIMTAAEFEAISSGDPVDADSLEGRMVQVQVETKDSGWPAVTGIIAARKVRSRAN